jgi:hypothetical protein
MLDRSLEDTLPYLFTLLGLSEGDDQIAQMGEGRGFESLRIGQLSVTASRFLDSRSLS